MTHQTSPGACDNRSATTRRSHRIGVVAMVTAFLAVGLTFVGLSTPETAEAAPVTFAQCNSIMNTPGLEVSCDVTITNFLDTTDGTHRSIVETTICTGAVDATTCVTTPETPSSDIVNRVEQCNYAANGGGAKVTCNVTVVNTITTDASTGTTAPTVNQCNDSSDGSGTMSCNPADAVTTDADIHQCNNSTNGGGSHTECTVTPSSTSDLWAVAIDQCNYSANGGGSFVTCAAQITTTFLPAAPPTTTAPPTTAPPATTPDSTTPDTTTPDTTPDSTVPGSTTPGSTVPATTPDRDLPTTTFVFTPTDVTLPETGPGSLVRQSGIGFAVLLIGLAALVVARRRQPA